MTKAICMNCGEPKFGAWVRCSKCEFSPSTLFDLTMSELYSDHHVDDEGLLKISNVVKNNQAVVKDRKGKAIFDLSIVPIIEQRLADQSFRDMLTLVKKAKDGFLQKQLNMHLIGPDGYESLIRIRGKDIDKKSFDRIRSEGDGDLYVSYIYDGGHKRLNALSKRDWYIFYDKMIMVDRQLLGGNLYINFLDKTFDALLDNYLKHGAITPPLNNDQPLSSAASRPASESKKPSVLPTGRESADQFTVSSLSEGQNQFALEIEALSDREASDAYGALVSVVHQLTRMKSGLGIPVALDDTEVFFKSFESYIDRLDKVGAKDLELDYETVRRSIFANSTNPNVRHGAKALMVVILGEMIRREGASDGKHKMAGYERARRMLDHLEQSLSKG